MWKWTPEVKGKKNTKLDIKIRKCSLRDINKKVGR